MWPSLESKDGDVELTITIKFNIIWESYPWTVLVWLSLESSENDPWHHQCKLYHKPHKRLHSPPPTTISTLEIWSSPCEPVSLSTAQLVPLPVDAGLGGSGELVADKDCNGLDGSGRPVAYDIEWNGQDGIFLDWFCFCVIPLSRWGPKLKWVKRVSSPLLMTSTICCLP